MKREKLSDVLYELREFGYGEELAINQALISIIEKAFKRGFYKGMTEPSADDSSNGNDEHYQWNHEKDRFLGRMEELI